MYTDWYVSQLYLEAPSDNDDDRRDEETAVIKRDLKVVRSTLYQTSFTGKVNKEASAGSSDSDGEEQLKQTLFSHKSKKTAESEGRADLGATATIQSETDHSRDARAVLERARKLNEELKGKEDDHKYHRQKGYAQYVKSLDTAQGSAANKKGPIHAPDFL